MDSHGWTMDGDFNTDNIQSKDGVDVVEIANTTGKITFKKDIRMESGSPVAGYSLISSNNQGDLEFGYGEVPLGTILLFESDTALFGYSLLTSKDDYIVYITKGSAAGGESGATDKSGSTWTQPTHRHNQSSHTHSGPNHRHGMNNHHHSAGSHFHSVPGHSLTGPEMARHNHDIRDYYYPETGPNHGGATNWDYIAPPASNNMGSGDSNTTSDPTRFELYYYNHYVEYLGFGDSHNHGFTGSGSGTTAGPSNSNTEYSGTGNTGTPSNNNTSYATTYSSWRPKGRNFTRQQRS